MTTDTSAKPTDLPAAPFGPRGLSLPADAVIGYSDGIYYVKVNPDTLAKLLEQTV